MSVGHFHLCMSCRQTTFYDLLKRMPRDPQQQVDFGSPDFDLVLSVVSTEAALAKRAWGLVPRVACGCCDMGVGAASAVAQGVGGSGWQGFESTFKACLGRAFSDTEVIASASLRPARGCRLSTLGVPRLPVDVRSRLLAYSPKSSRRPHASVRSGCAQGKHRAKVLMALVGDWVSRTICSCWHVGLGTAQDFHAATAWLREGLQWFDKQDRFAAPWSRHVLADGSEPLPNATAIADGRRGLPRCQIVDARLRSSCAHVLRMARKYRLAQPPLGTDDDWLGLKSGDSTARPPFAPRSGALVLGCDSTLRARAPACGRHRRPRL